MPAKYALKAKCPESVYRKRQRHRKNKDTHAVQRVIEMNEASRFDRQQKGY